MHRKNISFRIIFLILVLALTTGPLTSVLAIEAPLEVWVDPAFDSETPGFGYTHFNTIYEALSDIGIGGTVYVAPGTYTGFVVNTPGVSVLAASGAVVDGQSVIPEDATPQVRFEDGITIYAPDVTIKGFTVQNFPNNGIYVSYFKTRGNEYQPLTSPPENGASANATIDGNHLLNNDVAIYARGEGNVVRNNVCDSSLFAGILVEGENCTIENNTVTGSGEIGIGWSGNGFTVVNNSSSSNEVGLLGEGASHSLVRDNTLEDNMAGLAVMGEGNTVLNNAIRDNSVVGVYVVTNSYSRIKEIAIEPKPDENLITANMITGNGGDSFPSVSPKGSLSAAGFSVSGLSEGGGVFALGENILRRNHIAENTGYGLYVMDWNLIATDMPNGPEYDIVDARLNWWGHTSGPNHPDTNPFAQGQKVSDYVEYSPWLLAEPAAPEPLETLTDYLEAGESLTIADAVSARVVAGEGSVTVGQYNGNPTGKTLFGSVGAYVDVYVTSPHDIEELVVYLFYTGTPDDEEDLVLHWWDESQWVACSESGVNLEDQYVWAVITDATVPSLSDLTGTEFGAGLVEPADTDPEDPEEREELPDTGGLGIAGYGLLIMAAGLCLKRKK